MRSVILMINTHPGAALAALLILAFALGVGIALLIDKIMLDRRVKSRIDALTDGHVSNLQRRIAEEQERCGRLKSKVAWLEGDRLRIQQAVRAQAGVLLRTITDGED